MKHISCIIPAYNEEKTISQVISSALACPRIEEIVVINDASSDGTSDILKSFNSVRIITHTFNKGKSASIAAGITAVGGDHVLLLDGDLIGLDAQSVDALLEPVVSNRADVSISLRKNAPRAWHFIGLDYISGERVLPLSMLRPYIESISSLPAFGLEVFMNKLLIQEGYRIAVVNWPHVKSPYKFKKYGFWKGVVGDIKMMRDIFSTISIVGCLKQILEMLELKIQ